MSRISGSHRISLKDMLPGATEEQLKALAAGQPLPSYFDPVDWPLVNGLMCITQPGRATIARRAVGHFLKQTYPNKRLIIINATGEKLVTDETPLVAEYQINPPEQVILSALRNQALDRMDGEWWRLWDDDDIYHKNLLTFQMATRIPDHANLFSHQVRVHLWNSTVYSHMQEEGIAATGLYPRSAARFGGMHPNEDTNFWMANWAMKTNVVYTHRFPFNCHHMAIYHGKNVQSVQGFMVGHAEPSHRGQWTGVSLAAADYIRESVAPYGLQVVAPTPEPVSAPSEESQ